MRIEEVKGKIGTKDILLEYGLLGVHFFPFFGLLLLFLIAARTCADIQISISTFLKFLIAMVNADYLFPPSGSILVCSA